jgi:hypothetical protein
MRIGMCRPAPQCQRPVSLSWQPRQMMSPCRGCSQQPGCASWKRLGAQELLVALAGVESRAGADRGSWRTGPGLRPPRPVGSSGSSGLWPGPRTPTTAAAAGRPALGAVHRCRNSPSRCGQRGGEGHRDRVVVAEVGPQVAGEAAGRCLRPGRHDVHRRPVPVHRHRRCLRRWPSACPLSTVDVADRQRAIVAATGTAWSCRRAGCRSASLMDVRIQGD